MEYICAKCSASPDTIPLSCVNDPECALKMMPKKRIIYDNRGWILFMMLTVVVAVLCVHVPIEIAVGISFAYGHLLGRFNVL